MIFMNPSNPSINVDSGGPYSLWGFAHDGTAGIIPAHEIVVRNAGSEDASIRLASGDGVFTVSPGEIFRADVPAGDTFWANSAEGTSLQVIAIVR